MKQLASSILCSLLLLCACNSAVENYGTDNDGTLLVNLDISVALSDVPDALTRAGEEYADAANDNEKMQTLRIVIVRPNGVVEANRRINLTVAALEYGIERFKVVGNETKSIYLFVNEAAEVKSSTTNAQRKLVDFDFSKIYEGYVFPLNEVKNLKIRLENDEQIDEPLPMSERHEYKVTAEPEQSCELFVTRAAVKFTFNVTNNSGKKINLDQLQINKLAREEWYMPRVKYAEENAEGQREITEYEVPADVKYYNYNMPSAEIAAGATKKIAPVYLLESKYEDEPDAEGHHYSVDITVDGVNKKHYLPNLSALPRNTHVVVNIIIDIDEKVTCEVDVQPFACVDLNPSFGLDRDKDGNLINKRYDDGTYEVTIGGVSVRRDTDGDIIIRNFKDGSLFCLQVVFKDYIHDDSEVDYIYPIEKDAANGNQVILRETTVGGTLHGMEGLLQWIEGEGKHASIPQLIEKVNELDDVNGHVHDTDDRPLFVLDKTGHFQYVTYDDEGKPTLSPNDSRGDEILQVNGYQFRNLGNISDYLGTYLVRKSDGSTELRAKDGSKSPLTWPVSR